MNTGMLRRAEEIFERVVELPAGERSRVVREMSGGSAELVELVERLLESDGAAGGFLETPAASGMSGVVEGGESELPRSIGGYRVVRLIGAGGMGEVYEAEQENPRRSVAVKVIRPGAASRETMSRFRREAQLLGALHHPGIAAIYEAGVGEVVMASGVARSQPYFVMEYVRGEALSEYVARVKPTVSERLELFARICDAADHAHRAGIVHRDLKPANVLIEVNDGVAAPKVLDFGVARAEQGGSNTLRTDAMQLVGTVPYMSPEQISPAPDATIDARSDVYSLGVLFYQMLAGRLPHDLKDRSLADAARIIRDEEPRSLASTNAAFRGDLTTIAARALEKDPSRRYESAARLAEDVRRTLRHEPISARPPTTMYQLSKFARRNRALVSGVVAALIALSAGTVVSTVMYLRAEDARKKAVGLAEDARRASEAATKAKGLAEAESSKVSAINEYLMADFIGAAAPGRDGHEVKLMTVLLRAAENVEKRFEGQPLLEGEIRLLLADALGEVDMRKEAIVHARRGLELMSATAGELDRRTLDGHMVLMNELISDQQYEEVGALAHQVIDRFLPVFGADDWMVLRCRALLGESLQARGQFAEAEEILRAIVPVMERVRGPGDPNTIATLSSLIAVLFSTERHDEALALQAEVIGRCQASPDCSKLDAIAMRSNLINALYALKRYEEAGDQAMLLVPEIRKVLPENHVYRSIGLISAGNALAKTGRRDEALDAYLESYNGFVVSRGNGAFEVERAAARIRDVYVAKGDREKSVEWIPTPFSHRLLNAGDNEVESLTKGIEETAIRLKEFGLDTETTAILSARGDVLAPAGDARRARYYANLARACAGTGRGAAAREALETARGALGYSGNAAVDAALIETITIP